MQGHYALYFLSRDQRDLLSVLREHPICHSVFLQDAIFFVTLHVESVIGGVFTVFDHFSVCALHFPPCDF
jgi:hypothetical protein